MKTRVKFLFGEGKEGGGYKVVHTVKGNIHTRAKKKLASYSNNNPEYTQAGRNTTKKKKKHVQNSAKS